MNEGFNIIEYTELEKEGLDRCEEISIIQILKYIREDKIDSYGEYCVKGLGTLSIQTENYEQLSDLLNSLLADNVSRLTRSGATFQLEIDAEKANIQEWDKPCIVPKSHNEERYSLFQIFNRVEMENNNPNWYHSQLNIKS
jgi:hypothetical protein